MNAPNHDPVQRPSLRCQACGYDLGAGGPGPVRCPECGLVDEPWASRWRLRLAQHALTLMIWGGALSGTVWTLSQARFLWISDASSSPGPWAIALAGLPGALAALLGLVLLACASPPGGWARRLAWLAAASIGVVLGLLLGLAQQRAWTLSDHAADEHLLMARTILNWLLAVLLPLALGSALGLIARTALVVGLARLGAGCQKAAVFLPAAALALMGGLMVYNSQSWPKPHIGTSTYQFYARNTANPPPAEPGWVWTTGWHMAWALAVALLVLAAAAALCTAVVVRLRIQQVLDESGARPAV